MSEVTRFILIEGDEFRITYRDGAADISRVEQVTMGADDQSFVLSRRDREVLLGALSARKDSLIMAYQRDGETQRREVWGPALRHCEELVSRLEVME